MVRKKRGFAIVIALVIAVILLTSSVFLSKNTNQTIVVKQKSLAELKTQFAVKSAMQHAMLKCLLMPTQIYDAAAFSVGQNPYFDFAEYNDEDDIPSAFVRYKPTNQSFYIKLASQLTPGPRFIAKGPTLYPNGDKYRWNRIKAFNSDDLIKNKPDNLSQWPKDMNGADIPNPSLYLWKYYEGIKFEYDASHHESFNYPYNFYYHVKSMNVAGLDEQRKYNEEAVEIVVKGETSDDKAGDTSMESNAIVRIKRNGV